MAAPSSFLTRLPCSSSALPLGGPQLKADAAQQADEFPKELKAQRSQLSWCSLQSRCSLNWISQGSLQLPKYAL